MRHPRLLATALIGCLAAFLAITIMVLTGTGLVHVDTAINHRLSGGICCTATQNFWDRLTTVFSPPVDVTILLVTGVVLAIRWRRLAPAFAATWALAVGGVAGLGLKYAVGRAPTFGPYHAEGSYPSGHALSAIVFLGAAALIAGRGRVRPLLAVAVVVVTGLVGAGLVYDRYHWLTDVLGSMCLGPVLLWWVTLVPPYRSTRRMQRNLRLFGQLDPPRELSGSDAQRPPDDLLHDLGGAAVDRLHS